MLINGQNPANSKFGNTFTQDGLEGETFDYLLSNTPFGVNGKRLRNRLKIKQPTKALQVGLVPGCLLSVTGLCSFTAYDFQDEA